MRINRSEIKMVEKEDVRMESEKRRKKNGTEWNLLIRLAAYPEKQSRKVQANLKLIHIWDRRGSVMRIRTCRIRPFLKETFCGFPKRGKKFWKEETHEIYNLSFPQLSTVESYNLAYMINRKCHVINILPTKAFDTTRKILTFHKFYVESCHFP